MSTMLAAVIHAPGGPSALKLERVPIPVPTTSQVLIKVKAFGLNRSELFTRQGHSPGVSFPRILGIEATGIVEDAPGSSAFKKGDVVATAMGGMGRDFDGGYAEYTVVPASQVQKILTPLPWETLGAMPEAFQTAYGSLHTSLRLQPTDKLLIRGGTTSVGLVAAALAKDLGCHVTGTTRSTSNLPLLNSTGNFNEVLIDDADISKTHHGEKRFDKVLELIGPVTLRDSLRATKVGGIVCQTGIVAGKWNFEEFNPMEFIPTGVMLTVYGGGPEEFMRTPLEEIAIKVKEGKLKVPVGKVFRLEEIVEAHQCMEENKAGGKIVVLV
ncbi:zinc-binding oxidoreductase [Pseudohyphozyma bogoriensis]|nr:zinc-binding oxidoreductase [Pseudohyphozyma bogoriensis]